MEEDDAMDMEIDDTISNHNATIIVREATGVQIIGGPAADLSTSSSAPTTSTPSKVEEPHEELEKISTSKSADIVVLDDDEEPATSKNTQKKSSGDDQVEIIDLVEEKTVSSKCINYSCASGKDLMIAPNMCMSYYRVKNPGNGKKEVCAECFNLALKDYDSLATELLQGNILGKVKVAVRNDTVEIDDSDEEDVESRIPEMDKEDIALVEQNFEKILVETMKQLNFMAQVNKETAYLKEQNNILSKSSSELQAMIKDTRNTLDKIQLNLYNEFRSETRETCVISIIDDHSAASTPIIRNGNKSITSFVTSKLKLYIFFL